MFAIVAPGHRSRTMAMHSARLLACPMFLSPLVFMLFRTQTHSFGEPLGLPDGVSVGLDEGEDVGASEGSVVVGASEGSVVGASVGLDEGEADGVSEGSVVDIPLGVMHSFHPGKVTLPSEDHSITESVFKVCGRFSESVPQNFSPLTRSQSYEQLL